MGQSVVLPGDHGQGLHLRLDDVLLDIGSRHSGCVVGSKVSVLALKKASTGTDGWLSVVAGVVRRSGSSQSWILSQLFSLMIEKERQGKNRLLAFRKKGREGRCYVEIALPRGDREDFDATCFFFFWLFVDVSLAVVAGWFSSLKIGSGICVSVCGPRVLTALLSEETS